MNQFTRRDLLKTSALAAATLPFVSIDSTAEQSGTHQVDPNPWRGLKIGVATYTFRDLPIEAAIAGTRQVDLKYVSIKNILNHIDPAHQPEERKRRAKLFRDAGLVPLSVGNVGMKNDEADIRQAFEFARDCGVKTMVCSPDKEVTDVDQWVRHLDKMVKEFDIKLAIHNHGPENKQFPSPYDVWRAVEKYDSRIGLCIDVGHTARAGVDPAESIIKCKDRLYDLHLKDIHALGDKNTPIESGRGILNTKAILSALLQINYQGLAGFEYEKDGKDPIPGLAESLGFVKGVLSGLK